MSKLFFDSWDSLLRTALITVMAYVLLITLLRAAGKRTLSKMNAFDLIVTIALGSTLATVMLNKNVALLDGVLAFSLLIGLQFLLSFFSVRYRWFSELVKSTPALLAYRGQLLKGALLRERIAEDEIYALLREKGVKNIAEVQAIVLETDGSLTLLTELGHPSGRILQRVEGVPFGNEEVTGRT